MAFAFAGRDGIRTLRVPASAAADPRWRARLEAAELQPRNLPRSAIVLLRQLRVGVSALRGEAFRGAVEQAVCSAAYPARQTVGAAANAVVFSDEAELLACLARDALARRLDEGWWWPLWLGWQPREFSCVARAFIARPHTVPAALRLLAAGGAAGVETLIDALPLPQRQRLVERLELGFAATAIVTDAHRQAAQRAWFFTHRDHTGIEPEAESQRVTRITAASPPASATPAVWLRWTLERLVAGLPEYAAPVSLATLAPDRTPGIDLARASAAPSPPQPRDPLHVAASPAVTDTASAPTPMVPQRHDTSGALASTLIARSALRNSETTTPVPASNANAARTRTAVTACESAPGVAELEVSAERSAPALPAASLSPLRLTPAADVALGDAELPAIRSIDTGFGGLFYLLNVALALGLYGDFTQPRHDNLPLSPWAWLALIARRWFAYERLRADPLWPLLVELAGCSSEAALGADFAAPPWTAPAAWLRVFGEQPGAPPQRRGQRLQTGSHFCSTDRPLPGLPPDTPQQARRRWLMHCARYLAARLRRALPDAANAAEIRALLVCQPARVEIGRTELRVQFALATLPLAIRYAGLDRDIGWLPAAGLGIYFEYH